MHYFILISVIIVAGASQGLLLPLLTVMLEHQGVSSDLNGLNATMLYIGIFSTLFFIEKLLKRLGFKRLLVYALTLITCVLLLFPVFKGIWVWFALRFLVGVGDSALHYASQLWVMTTSTEQNRGRTLSFYGMSYGIGFSIGPLGMNLLHFGEWAPFVAIALLCLVVLAAVVFILPNYQVMGAKNDGPALEKRYLRSFQWAWFALLPAFLYGYTEASMNSSFPIYALRIGLDQEWISFLLPFFGIGGLILQLPLGMLSDRIGRKKVLMGAGLLGGIAFLVLPVFGANAWAILVLFMVAGGMLGSFYSLGLAFAADVLPRAYLPSANVVATFIFSIGSIVAPNLAGLGMQHISISSMFWLLGAFFIAFSFLGVFYKRSCRVEPIQAEAAISEPM
ncbi:MFS transporter [Paenibacillus selenitireducens]|uniref:MFS transporter n=1 Tax=Paenibacillus selenitireducens TaxID=1324314 RepID=A0A1T2X339_9BACL|nr:MFS transporter [Paenibacillus selenitireducens]